MSAEEQDQLYGKLKREERQLARKQACLHSKLQRISDALVKAVETEGRVFSPDFSVWHQEFGNLEGDRLSEFMG